MENENKTFKLGSEALNKELESKWWAGRDKKRECPRLEFVGMLHADGDIDHWATYYQLVWSMHNFPNRYKVIKI